MRHLFIIFAVLSTAFSVSSQQNLYQSFKPGLYPWIANDSEHEGDFKHINVHGGGILLFGDTYYWFGEDKTDNTALVGVRCYSSIDLYNWKSEGVALSVDPEGSGSDIERGCIIERPKVIYNEKTKKFVMYFHLELKGQSYAAARVGIASADKVTGPYTFHKSLRPNPGKLPLSLNGDESKIETLFYFGNILNDYKGGHMSRDMTLFVDPDTKKAYHIYSSEGNRTLHIAELSDDYLNYTGRFERIAPGGNNEAPAIFKRDNRYYMITSDCTGWTPNAARQFSATNIMGPWKEFPNPCIGDLAYKTFKSQSTFILPVKGKKNAYIFMGDRWMPDNPITASHVWLPIQFDNGILKIEWSDEWDLSYFDEMNTYANLQKDIAAAEIFLSEVSVGKGIYEYPQSAYDDFKNAVEDAKKFTLSMTDEEIIDGIIKLSNAATTFRGTKNLWRVNEIEPGDYYIKLGDKYLTNDNSPNNTQLKFCVERTTDINAQIFTLEKDDVTGRYKIISKLDDRIMTERGKITNRTKNDHLLRMVNFRYNGTKYAIQFDGKSGAHWTVDTDKSEIKKSDYRELVDSDEQFIFTMEKVEDVSSIDNIIDSQNRSHVFSENGCICVNTVTPTSISVFSEIGLLKYSKNFNAGNIKIPVPSGVYIVQLKNKIGNNVQKVIIR